MPNSARLLRLGFANDYSEILSQGEELSPMPPRKAIFGVPQAEQYSAEREAEEILELGLRRIAWAQDVAMYGLDMAGEKIPKAAPYDDASIPSGEVSG